MNHEPPIPITVYLTHLPPHTRTIPGYVADNNYTLEYILIQGSHTVADLLAMIGRYGDPSGNGILGVRYMNATSTPNGNDQPTGGLALNVELYDGDRLSLVVA